MTNKDVIWNTTLPQRSTLNFCPSAGQTWKHAAGTSWTLWWWAVTPMWTTPASALPSSAACWKPRATRWACWPSPATPTARTSSGSANPSTASSLAAATWTAWSATIPWPRSPRRGRIFSRRQGRCPPGPQRHRVHQTGQGGLPGPAGHHGGLEASCGALPTTITGWTPCCPASPRAPVRTSSALAWANTRPWRSPAVWPPENRWSRSPMWTAPAT